MNSEFVGSRLDDLEVVLGRPLPEQPSAEDGGLRQVVVLASNPLLKMCLADKAAARQTAMQAGQPFDEEAWEKAWRPSDTQLREAYDNLPLSIPARLAAIDDFRHYSKNPDKASSGGVKLRPHQRSLPGHTASFLNGAHGKQWRHERDSGQPIHGQVLHQSARIIMPVRAGKTVVAATTMEGMGIGQPISEDRPQIRKGIYLVPSRQLSDQARDGRDGKGSLLHLAPSLGSVTLFRGGEKDDSGNVAVATSDSFPELADKLIGETSTQTATGVLRNSQVVTSIFVDEGHRGLEPQVKEALERLAAATGAVVVGMTATPYFNLTKRHVDQIFKHELYRARMLDYINDGILNSVELVGISTAQAGVAEALGSMGQEERAPADRELRTKFGAEFTTKLLQRHPEFQGIIYCARGGNGAQARAVAHLLRKAGLSAAAISSAPVRLEDEPDVPYLPDDVLREHIRGNLSVITATDMIKEGTDLEKVDFIGLLRRFLSVVELEQAVGRGMGFDPNNPVTLIFQCISLLKDSLGNLTQKEALAWDLFERKIIEQGEIIGPHRRGQGGGGDGSHHSTARDIINELSPELRSLIEKIQHKTVREARYGPGKWGAPSEGFLSFTGNLLGPDEESMSPVTMRKYFEEADIVWEDAIDPQTGIRDYYFDPQHLELMREIVKPRATAEMRTANALAEELGETRYMVNRAVAAFGFEGTPLREITVNVELPHFTPDQQARIKQYLEAIPVATPTDVAIKVLTEELHVNRSRLVERLRDEYSITHIYKRMGLKQRGADFLTAEQAAIARRDSELNVPLVPEDEQWTAIIDMVSESGKDRGIIENAINAAGYQDRRKTFKAPIPIGEGDSSRTHYAELYHLPTPLAKAVMAVVEAGEFPEHAISVRGYAARKGYSEKGIISYAKQHNVPLKEVTRGKMTYQFIDEAHLPVLDTAIDNIEAAQPGWRPVTGVARVMGLSHDTVKKHISPEVLSGDQPEHARRMQPDPSKLTTLLHLSPQQAAYAARRAISGRAIQSDFTLTRDHIGLLTAKEGDELTKLLQTLRIPVRETYTDDEARRVYDALPAPELEADAKSQEAKAAPHGSQAPAASDAPGPNETLADTPASPEAADAERSWRTPEMASLLGVSLSTANAQMFKWRWATGNQLPNIRPGKILLGPDAAATIARSIVAETIKKRQHTQLDVEQIALLAGLTPSAVTARIEQHNSVSDNPPIRGVGDEQEPRYNDDALKQIFKLLGISIDTPAIMPAGPGRELASEITSEEAPAAPPKALRTPAPAKSPPRKKAESEPPTPRAKKQPPKKAPQPQEPVWQPGSAPRSAAPSPAPIRRQPGEATRGLPPETSQHRRTHNIPADAIPVRALLQFAHMTESEAVEYVHGHGGVTQTYPDTNGHPIAWVSGASAGLLRHRDTTKYPPQKPAEEWLNRQEIAEKTGKPLDAVDEVLNSPEIWRVERQSLRTRRLTAVRQRKDADGGEILDISERPKSRATPVLWAKPKDEGVDAVLPHYHRDIVEYVAATVGSLS